MSNKKYAVVASEVNAPRSEISYNGDIPTINYFNRPPDEAEKLKPDPDLKNILPAGQLNAESVGQLLVEMSENPSIAQNPDLLGNREAVVRACLDVAEINDSLTTQQKEDILRNTSVSIAFEERERSGSIDKNTRIVVVPADETLLAKRTAIENEQDSNPRPPLTYELDERIMLNFLEKFVIDTLNGFFNSANEHDIPEKTQKALVRFVKKAIKDKVEDVSGADVVKKPVRVFHRSVGIYATNMCR